MHEYSQVLTYGPVGKKLYPIHFAEFRHPLCRSLINNGILDLLSGKKYL